MTADVVHYFAVSTCQIVTVSSSGNRVSSRPDADAHDGIGGAVVTFQDGTGRYAVTGTYESPPNATTQLYLAMRPGDKLQLCTGPDVQVTGKKFYQEAIISPISERLKKHWVFTNALMMVKVVLSPYMGA